MIEDDVARPAGRGDRRDVDAAERRVDRRLEPEHLRPIADDAFGLPQLLERDEARLIRSAERVRQQVQRAAVDRGAADHFVPDFSRPSSAVDVAAMPLAKSIAVSAPSILAIVCSTATTVGLP
jgi:hypothetical protein